jgi:FKBP-type peptidyl-prolyl cis-trans isomerase
MLTITKKILFVLSVGVLFTSCKLNTETDTDTKNKENDATIQKYLTDNKLSYKSTVDGMYYNILGQGTRSPLAKDLVTLHYTRSILNGAKIDSSSIILNRPGRYVFGLTYDMFNYAINYMKEGESGTFILPSRLAFGSNSVVNVPYAVIKIDIKLLKVRNEEEQIEDFIADKKYDVSKIEKTSSGLRFIKTKSNPTGDAPKSTQTVKVAFTGRLLYDYYTVNTDGSKIWDSKFDAGDFELTLGTKGAIVGFEEGINKLKVGEKAIIIFPSFVGYGASGSGKYIPPYSPLYFEIELVGFK